MRSEDSKGRADDDRAATPRLGHRTAGSGPAAHYRMSGVVIRPEDPFAVAERIAETASITTLAQVISPGGAVIEIAGAPFRFRCPRCRQVDHNGGTAEVRANWRWSCFHCKSDGTVAELRRVALESPDAVMALLAGEQ